jgi:hypothetical protein
MTRNACNDTVVNLNKRELATILFALRSMQANIDDLEELLYDSCHFEDAFPLNNDEIDELCELLNMSS